MRTDDLPSGRIDDRRAVELARIINAAPFEQARYLHHIEAAAGALFAAQIFGWEAVKVCTLPVYWKRHRDLLGVRIEDYAHARTEHAAQIRGVRWLDTYKAFRRRDDPSTGYRVMEARRIDDDPSPRLFPPA